MFKGKSSDKVVFFIGAAVVVGVSFLIFKNNKEVEREVKEEEERKITTNLTEAQIQIIEQMYKRSISTLDIANKAGIKEREVIDYIIGSKLELREMNEILRFEFERFGGMIENKMSEASKLQDKIFDRIMRDTLLTRSEITSPIKYVAENMKDFSNLFTDSMEFSEVVLTDIMETNKLLVKKLDENSLEVTIKELKEISDSYEESAVIISEATKSSVDKMLEVTEKLGQALSLKD